jgi:hypothetical protein
MNRNQITIVAELSRISSALLPVNAEETFRPFASISEWSEIESKNSFRK